jgi:hypothetical protein
VINVRPAKVAIQWDGGERHYYDRALVTKFIRPLNVLDQIEEAVRPSIEVKDLGGGDSGLHGAHRHHNAERHAALDDGGDGAKHHITEGGGS